MVQHGTTFSCKTFTIALNPRLPSCGVHYCPTVLPSLHAIQGHRLWWIGSCWIKVADALSCDAELWLSSSVEPVWKAGAARPCTNT